jgi:beta-N-acetylhexosaminidase
MIDVAGLALAPDERELLGHPLVGGVILFTRNYQSPAQLGALTASIHALRNPPLMIAVDHEGGRVQRFVEGFTRLPSMRALGRVYDREPALAANLASAVGVVLAAELRGHGVDFSFAPVLDIDFGSSSVIGDRAFHATATGVTALAGGLVAGMARMGTGGSEDSRPWLWWGMDCTTRCRSTSGSGDHRGERSAAVRRLVGKDSPA